MSIGQLFRLALGLATADPITVCKPLKVCGLVLAAVLVGSRPVSADTITYGDLASWQSAAGAVTTLTFEENGPSFDRLFTAYGCCAMFGGLLFNASAGAHPGEPFNPALFTVDPALSPLYAGIGTGDVLTAQHNTFAFSLEISGLNATALAFNWLHWSADDISVLLSNGDTLVLSAPAFTANFIGLTSTSPITNLRFIIPPVGLDENSGLNIDNLSFNSASPTPVPEPATLVLLGSGLAALGRRAWKAKRRALRANQPSSRSI